MSVNKFIGSSGTQAKGEAGLERARLGGGFAGPESGEHAYFQYAV